MRIMHKEYLLGVMCVGVAAVLGLGCRGPDPVRMPPVDPPPGVGPSCYDDVPTLAPATGAASTYVYVISDIVVDETPIDANSAQSGFNLDGIYTAEDGSTPFSCGKPDQPSDLDPEENRPGEKVSAESGRASPTCLMGCRPGARCRGGVDNQLPTMIDALGSSLSTAFFEGMRPVIRANVQSGTHPIVLVVSDVQSLVNDDAVTITVFDVVQNFSQGCDGVRPDQMYSRLADRVMAGDPVRSVYPTFNGSIRAGRLRSLGTLLPFYFPLPGQQEYRFEVKGARLNVDLTDAVGERGNAGGYINGGDGVTYARAVAVANRDPDPAGFLRAAIGFLGGFVDIQQPIPTEMTRASGLCVDRSNPDMPRFGNIGVGFRFSLVRAQLAAGVVEGRAPGACGSPEALADAGVGDGGDASVVDARVMDARDAPGDQEMTDANAMVDGETDR